MNYINIPRIVAERGELAETPYILISIRDTDAPKIVHEYSNCKEVLHLHFDDITPRQKDRFESIKDFVLFDQGMAEEIVDFVNKHDVSNCYIHCTAGVSRSAGVASALSKHYNGDDMEYFKKYVPNTYVNTVLFQVLLERDV